MSLRRPWALVTGASTGIGREFACQLAARGYSLVVVARDAGRLEALAAELRTRHEAGVEVMPADLTSAAGLARVEARLAAEPAILLLVNNAGMGVMGAFVASDIDTEESELLLNMVAPVRLARAALPGMVARKRGAVINVSSLGGFQPGPWNATYSATKAFLNSFTEALHEELRDSGVRVQALCPGMTRTEFQERAGAPARSMPGWMWQEPGAVVAASLRGLDRGTLIVIPGWVNRSMALASRLAPRPLVLWLSGSIGRRITR